MGGENIGNDRNAATNFIDVLSGFSFVVDVFDEFLDLPPLPDEPKNPGLSRDPNADLPPLPNMSAPLSAAPNADLPPLPEMSAPLSAAPNGDLGQN